MKKGQNFFAKSSTEDDWLTGYDMTLRLSKNWHDKCRNLGGSVDTPVDDWYVLSKHDKLGNERDSAMGIGGGGECR